MIANFFASLKRKIGIFSVNRVPEDEAKKYLNNLREQELSVGAAFRRGEVVNSAPGQLRSDKEEQTAKRNKIVPAAKTDSAYSEKPESNELGFATSLAVTMATDSPILGYAAGGSLSGAAVGAILNECSSNDDDE